MTNELAVNNVNEEYEKNLEVVVGETDEYVKVRLPDGTYKRNAKFEDFTSFVPEEYEDKVWLAQILTADEGSDLIMGMKDHAGTTFELEHLMFEKFTKIDEKTGQESFGVLTRIITPERDVYATTSKAVYFTLHKIMKMMGYPTDENYVPLSFTITKRKRENGDQINLELVIPKKK